MNDYDKTGRYLVKRDSVGFFRWLRETSFSPPANLIITGTAAERLLPAV